MGILSIGMSRTWSAWQGGRLRAALYARPRITALVFLAAILSLIFLGPWHLAVMQHESVHFKFAVWRAVGKSYQPAAGEYVMFIFSGDDPNGMGLKKGYSLTKRVGCTAGQVISVSDDGRFYCNGQYLGAALSRSPASKKNLVRAAFDGSPIPEGKVFMIGDIQTSYDSRYWGLADVNDIYGVVSLRI